MPELTIAEVSTLAKVAGLTLSGDDLVEVARQLNTMLAEMEICHPDLDRIVPLPFLPLEKPDDEL